MTVLQEYQRLEAIGLWRASSDEQRRDVVLSLGDSTLLIADMHDKVLAHWSLPAIMRENPGQFPALYYPDGNPNETLELNTDQADMIDALTRVRARVDKTRPRPGRLRLVFVAAFLVGLIAFVWFGIPPLARKHALNVVPPVTIIAIGEQLLAQIQKTTGAPCGKPEAKDALKKLNKRLADPSKGPILVVTEGVNDVLSLPGGARLVNHALIVDYEGAEVLAGYLLAEEVRNHAVPPMERLIDFAGTLPTLRLMGTGHLPQSVIENYARDLLNRPRATPDSTALIARFKETSVNMAPYLSVTNDTETTPPDTITTPVLPDGDFLRLQTICDP